MIAINKDITTIKKGIICHQVNTKGVMGAGLAKQIRTKFPEVYKAYNELCKRNQGEDLLGNLHIVGVEVNLLVANLFGQSHYGGRGVRTNYGALQDALEETVIFGKEHNLPIYVPYNMGCGLAGGSWNTVKDIIKKLEEDYETVITVCKYFGG